MKRLASCILTIVMALSLVPTAFAADSGTPPYSLQYLEGIEGTEYVRYTELDDLDSEGYTQTDRTLEMYDVIDLWISNDTLWTETVQYFRNAFTDAGFQETIYLDDNDQEQYWYSKDLDVFVILGEQDSYDILDEGALVYVIHTHVSTTTDDQQDVAVGLSNFQTVNTYTAGQFTDVAPAVWYESSVQAAYELGLVKGSTATTFNPDGNITIAEALVLACRLHSIYYTGTEEFIQGSPWYQVYVDYAVSNGIITSGQFSDVTVKATRAQFAAILAAALPSDALPAINHVEAGEIPDVVGTESYGAAVYLLYNAGILTGSDEYGTFNPNSNIMRSEVATIVTRMAKTDVRKMFTLSEKE